MQILFPDPDLIAVSQCRLTIIHHGEAGGKVSPPQSFGARDPPAAIGIPSSQPAAASPPIVFDSHKLEIEAREQAHRWLVFIDWLEATNGTKRGKGI